MLGKRFVSNAAAGDALRPAQHFDVETGGGWVVGGGQNDGLRCEHTTRTEATDSHSVSASHHCEWRLVLPALWPA